MSSTSWALLKQLLQLLGVMPLLAFTSVAVSIIAPTIVITIYAWFSQSSQDISAFALLVAEPISFVAVTVVAVWISRKKYRHVTSFAWALCSGLGASIGLLFAALWIGEVDKWAVVSIIVVPIVSILYWKFKLRDDDSSS